MAAGATNAVKSGDFPLVIVSYSFCVLEFNNFTDIENARDFACPSSHHFIPGSLKQTRGMIFVASSASVHASMTHFRYLDPGL